MAVVPDFLLNSSGGPSALGKATPLANVSKTTALDSGAQRQSRFADVYAKQQSAKPVANGKDSDKPAAAKSDDSQVKRSDNKVSDQADTGTKVEPQDERKPAAKDVKDAKGSTSTPHKATSADEPEAAPATTVAATVESGNDLPVAKDDAQAPAVAALDPLFLLGMTGQFPTAPAPTPSVKVATDATDATASDLTSVMASQSGTVQTPLQQLQAAVSQLGQETQTASAATNDATTTTPAKPTEGQPAEASAKAAMAAQAAQLTNLPNSSLGQVPATDQAAALATLTATVKGEETAKIEGGGKSDAITERLTALSQSMSTPAQTARPVVAAAPGQALSPQAGNFSEAVVDRVMWMSSQNLKSADIQMEPAQLGKLEVRIDMSQDQTQVSFVSPHAEVREALDNSAARLRELFAQQGMNLANVNVSDQSGSQAWQQSQQNARGSGTGRSRGETASVEEEGGVQAAQSQGSIALGERSLVDYYA